MLFCFFEKGFLSSEWRLLYLTKLLVLNTIDCMRVPFYQSQHTYRPIDSFRCRFTINALYFRKLMFIPLLAWKLRVNKSRHVFSWLALCVHVCDHSLWDKPRMCDLLTAVRDVKVSSRGLYAKTWHTHAEMRDAVLSIRDSVTDVNTADTWNVWLREWIAMVS